MTYLNLAVKMFRKRAVQYRLFWLSQAVVIMLFFSVYVFYRTPEFMEYFVVISQQIVDSTNIGMLGILLFAVCFIPASHWLLFQRRTKDFATLLSIGMSRGMMYGQIFVEHLILDLSAAVAGLIAGSGLGMLFYEGMTRGLGIGPFSMPLCLEAYVEAGRKILVIDGISIAGILITVMCHSIRRIEQMKGRAGHRRTVCKRKGKDRRKPVENIYLYRRKRQVQRESFFLQLISGFLTALFFFMMILAVINVKWIDHCGEKDHPFDLVYVNEVVGLVDQAQYTKEELDEVFKECGVSPVVFKELDCYRNGAYNLLNVETVNTLFASDYQVDSGTALGIIRQTPGYWSFGQSEPEVDKKVLVPLAGGQQEFVITGNEYNMLFGFPCVADRTVLLNAKDYQNLDEQVGDYYLQKNYLITFQNWQESGPVVEKMQQYLGEESSRALYSRYLYEQSSSQNQIFELVLFTIVGVTLYGGSLLCIHFWRKIRRQDREIEYKKLWDIGMSEKEILKESRASLNIIFWQPYLVGMGCGVLLSCLFSGGDSFLKNAMEASIVELLVFTGIHILVHQAVVSQDAKRVVGRNI